MTGNRFPLAALSIIAVMGAGLIPSRGHAADSGATLFSRYCFACHAVEPGRNKLGPSLHGVVGRAAATVPSFLYSRALRGAGPVWTEDTLNAFLTSPRTLVPGTTMMIKGVPDPAERATLIEYLKAN